METTNENIRKILEMLDNPDAYTEQEILDLINRDEDTRKTYRLIVEAKKSSRYHKSDKPVDLDAAWLRFNKKLQPKRHSRGWMNIAASIVGVLLVSGIAFATLRVIRQNQKAEISQTETMDGVKNSSTTHPADTLSNDTTTIRPIIYDNIPLEKILSQIAAHYDVKVIFANDEVRQLRFRFVWNPQQDIDQVVSDLNQFERLTARLRDNEITIE